MTRLIELLVFSRRSIAFSVLTSIGLFGWIAVHALGGLALTVALMVLGLALIGALIAWMTGGIERWR
ncbi:MAG TPA: hypothetical protein VJO33_12025 [Gemmatimonadaceae bacterium]|nr:hypothetical protein [Gemmatimonadaceae bacterium]